LRYNVGKSGYHTRQFITAELPFDHIAMDTITGFPTTERGNNVILVITDLCTRFKLLLPQQTKSATETAANVWKVFCTFPLPKIVQSDNGTEFYNQVIKSLFDLHGVDHRTIAAYNPRANGSAENAVGSCQQVLRKLTNGNMKDWDDFLPSAQLALNSKATILGSLRATFWAVRPYSTTTGGLIKLSKSRGPRTAHPQPSPKPALGRRLPHQYRAGQNRQLPQLHTTRLELIRSTCRIQLPRPRTLQTL
jgi:transposase InsO family protein